MPTSTVAGIAILLFATPAYWYLFKVVGGKRAVGIFLFLNVFGISIETIALKTSFPYGQFSYSNDLGYKLFGITPWSVGISWSMLLIGVTALGQSLKLTRWQLLLGIVGGLLLTDLVLDPGAVALGYWHYAHSNGFYGVPWSNFLGWLLSGTLGSALFLKLIKNSTLPLPAALSLFITVLFYTGVGVYKGLVIPALIGGILLVVMGLVYRWARLLEYQSGSQTH